ncbi:MAG: DUF1343 domain-containing protein [Bacteroidetes bacterium]|nr:DUF1343 domain-containing protein [Bacteroidota bacterium]
MKQELIFTSVLCFLFLTAGCQQPEGQFLTGADRTREYFPLLEGKSIGLVCNATSIIHKTHLADSLCRAGFRIGKIFSPEHGFRGEAEAGEKVHDEIDQSTGVKVVSLYGKKRKPDASDLEGLDVLLFDIQDVGVRFFTYISTLTYVMEACAANGIPLIVLDRPNPNRFYCDGPVLKQEFRSFVGLHPVPVVYGMTIGEYALMVNGERWLENNLICSLTVIPCSHYDGKSMPALAVKPSPNLTSMNAIYLYPGICFFEGTQVSLGRGTRRPFEVIGFPGCPDGDTVFMPVSIPGMSVSPLYQDLACRGFSLIGESTRDGLPDSQLPLNWLLRMYRLYPDSTRFFNSYFNTLAGNSDLQQQIRNGWTEAQIRASWKNERAAFFLIRKKYLLYNE